MTMIHLPELSFFVGLLLLGAGLWMAWPPLCPIVLGVVFLTLGILGASRWASSRNS